MPMSPRVTISQLRSTATVDLMTAAQALGLGRTKAYELARRNEFPCKVLRIGENYRIPTPGLLELLGVHPEQRPASPPGYPAPPGQPGSGAPGRAHFNARRPAGA
jgi:hypothetical protein